MQEYRNLDGTYTSPKNGKVYKSEKAIRAHLSFKRTDKAYVFDNVGGEKYNCKFCGEEFGNKNISKHEDSCYLNPLHLILCLSCNSPIKDYKKSKGTCSHSCSNKFFRKLRNKPEKYTLYSTICFHHHEKKCIICGEEKIVATHHYNEDHSDDRPENLVPLCPTHHQYVHSRYKNEVISIIDKYVEEFKNKLGVG